MPSSAQTIFGLLNIHKPVGPSSRWVVDRVSRITGIKKIGHAGTLDPLASGVLVLCLGTATRLVEYVQQGTKIYRAEIQLGATTTTYDAEGEIVATSPVPPLTENDFRDALLQFVGTLEQRPPAFSAIKIDGVAAYHRARRGQVVEMQPRRVTIEQIQIISWLPPALSVEIVCSPGTYIRSLAHDFGQALGCGAYLSRLERTASGRFRVEDAVSPDALAAAENWPEFLLPAENAVLDFPVLKLDEISAAALLHGNTIPCPTAPDAPLVRVHDASGQFIALARFDELHACWKPEKVFLTDAN